jgi:hypothetical protein
LVFQDLLRKDRSRANLKHVSMTHRAEQDLISEHLEVFQSMSAHLTLEITRRYKIENNKTCPSLSEIVFAGINQSLGITLENASENPLKNHASVEWNWLCLPRKVNSNTDAHCRGIVSWKTSNRLWLVNDGNERDRQLGWMCCCWSWTSSISNPPISDFVE